MNRLLSITAPASPALLFHANTVKEELISIFTHEYPLNVYECMQMGIKH